MDGPQRDIVFYDGFCGFCSKSVRFLIARDKTGHFYFAPLAGETAAKLLPSGALPDSLVVRIGEAQGRLIFKSEACLYLAQWLDRPWNTMGALAGFFPRRFADWIYEGVAKNRHLFFKRFAGDSQPSLDQKQRFLP